MSLLRSIRQQLGLMSGGNESQNHFWDGSVPNQLSLKRGTPDAPGAELIKALNGVLSFPNQGQSLTSPGYVKLPGGLIVQWGDGSTNNSNGFAVTFPVQFPNACLHVFGIPNVNSTEPADGLFLGVAVALTTQNGAQFNTQSAASSRTYQWLAIGY